MSPHDLVAALRSTDGTMRIANPSPDARAAWRRLIHAAKHDQLVPSGFHVHHTGRDRGDLVIELVAGEHPNTVYRERRPAALAADPAPTQIHPVAAELLDNWLGLGLSESSVGRARTIVHAL